MKPLARLPLATCLAALAAALLTSPTHAAAPAPTPPTTRPATATAPSTTPATKPAPLTFDTPLGNGKLLLSEDFDSTKPGEIPKGFTKTGTGSVTVVDTVSHSGKNSLKIEPIARGARRITTNNADLLKALGGEHWGRLYFKVNQPSPIPASGVIHSTLVAGAAKSPLFKDSIEVRVLDTVMNTKNMHQFIYNVQPGGGRAEFGKGGQYTHTYTDQWTLAEWHIDYATQSYHLYINGKEVKDVAVANGKDNFQKSEIPEVFESLSFGWYNYQAAGTGFTAWIDDIALSKERIGNLGLPQNP